MIGTWHDSCTHACTCTTLHHNSQIARGAPSPRSSIGRPARPSSPGRAATSSFDNEQMLPGSERGARSFVACRATPVRAFLLRVQGFSLKLGQFLGIGRSLNLSASIGGCSCAPALLNQHRRQRAFQALSQRLPSHFKTSVPVAFKPSDGAIGSDQKAIGVYQNDDC